MLGGLFSPSFAAPLLPDSKSMLFDGTFQYWNESTGVHSTCSISGIVNFTLDYQIPTFSSAGLAHLDHVSWSFDLETFDKNLIVNGGFDNEEASYDESDKNESVHWDHVWDGSGFIEESYTDVDWDSIWMPGVTNDPYQPEWNLLTNENFLPRSMQIYPGTRHNQDDEFLIDIDMRPVPEPSVLILLCTGAACLVSSRKRIFKGKTE
jgi:hypothetical protein